MEKMCLQISRVPRGNKGFENLLQVNFVRGKNRISTKRIHQLSISDVKMLLLTGKIGKTTGHPNTLSATKMNVLLKCSGSLWEDTKSL